MTNHPEVVRKQSSESVGLPGTKIVTELFEPQKAVQEDGILLKSEISEYTSQSNICNTQSVQGSEEQSLKKHIQSTGKDSGDKEELENVDYTEVKTVSDVEIRDRFLTREDTFGPGSEMIEEVPGSIPWVSQESHIQEEQVVIKEGNVEFPEGENHSSPVVVVDERCLILKGYGRNYGSSESNYSKSSLSTTKNMQLLKKSPFSTRNGSVISRDSSLSRKEGRYEVLNSKGSDLLTESDWKDIMSKSLSYEASMKEKKIMENNKGKGTLESLKGRNYSGQGYSETPRSQKEYQVAYREFSRGYKSNYAANSSSETYKLTRRNAMRIIDPLKEDVTEEKELVARYMVNGEDERGLMCYKKIENMPVECGDKGKEYCEGTKGKDELIKGYCGSRELKRDVSTMTMADYDYSDKGDEKKKRHVMQNNIGFNLIVKRAPMYKRFERGVRAMDKFNGFFSVMRVVMVKHTMVLATAFWVVSFWCLYPAMFTGWLKNEIKYSKGDIKGSSVTLIGLNKINRYDEAYLKDGALLTLSRKVTFKDILNDEDPTDDYEEYTTTITKVTPAKLTIKTTIMEQGTVPEARTETGKRGPEESSDKEDEYESTPIKTDSVSGTIGSVSGTGVISTGSGTSTSNSSGIGTGTSTSNATGTGTSNATGTGNGTDKGSRSSKPGTGKPDHGTPKSSGTDRTGIAGDSPSRKERDTVTKEEKHSTKSNIRGNNKVVERVNKSVDIYRHCSYERNFIKKSCCFRDMCEVGNLDDKDTKYFKSLYGATVYDIHYAEFKNLQKGGNIAMSTGMLSMFFSFLVLMITLSRLGAFPHPKLKEAAFNLGIISWVISIFMSLLGFLLWNHYAGGAVCVDEAGRSKPCSLHTGSILFILHIIFEGIGLILEIVNSVLLKPKEIVTNAVV